MTRQDRFEAYFADSRRLEPGTITQYRFNTQDGYRLPKLAMAYRDFCAGMGAVVVELPTSPYMPDAEPAHMTPYEIGEAQGRCDMWSMIREVIEASGAQVEP